MRSKNVFQTLAVAGLGATLMLASSARAQEITNTEFSDGPYVATFAEPVAQANPASTPVMTEAELLQATAAIGAPAVPEQASLVPASGTGRWVVAALLAALCAISLYILIELSALIELKKANRNPRNQQGTRVSTRTA